MPVPRHSTPRAEVRSLTLSSMLGLVVRSRRGTRIGRLKDLTVHLNSQHPQIARMVVRTPKSTILVPWGLVERLDHSGVTVSVEDACASADSDEPELEPPEILLGRDVLDTQVVDLRGLRLSRVSDVLLVVRGHVGLEVAAVHLGLAALLPRLGLRHGVHSPQPAVDWKELHFTSPRAHSIQLSTGSAGYRRLNSVGLAELLARLSTQNAAEVLQSVDSERAVSAVRNSHPVTAERLLQALDPVEAHELSEALARKEQNHLNQPVAQDYPWRQGRYLRTSGWRRLRPANAPGGSRESFDEHDDS